MATVADGDVRLPSKALFMRGEIPEPLTGEERQWLWEQLHAYPSRVNEARTCAIGALTDMAVTEFCRLMAERAALERLTAPADGDVRELIERYANAVADVETAADRGGPQSWADAEKERDAAKLALDAALERLTEQSDETMVERA